MIGKLIIDSGDGMCLTYFISFLALGVPPWRSGRVRCCCAKFFKMKCDWSALGRRLWLVITVKAKSTDIYWQLSFLWIGILTDQLDSDCWVCVGRKKKKTSYRWRMLAPGYYPLRGRGLDLRLFESYKAFTAKWDETTPKLGRTLSA